MERIGIAVVAVMLVLAGCAGPRVLSDDVVATGSVAGTEAMNPFEFEFSRPLEVTPVSDELGAPPAPPLPDFPAAMPDDSAAPTPAIPEELTPVPDAPDAPPAAESMPAAVAFPPPAPCAKRLGRCCQPSAPCLPKPTCCSPCDATGDNCRKCPCPDPCGNPCGGYVGVGFVGGPGLGFLTEFGINVKRTKKALWSVEAAMMYQDFYDNVEGGDLNNAGKMNMFRAGMRWRFQPCCRWHVTARAGLGWMHAGNDGVPSLELADIDARGDYIGAYAGIGLEFDIGARWSTGPELTYFYGWEAGGNGNTASVPSLIWHLNYKF
jgi:hypothetical protein